MVPKKLFVSSINVFYFLSGSHSGMSILEQDKQLLYFQMEITEEGQWKMEAMTHKETLEDWNILYMVTQETQE